MSSSTRGAALVAAICALACANASAATFVVDKTADDPGTGACDPGTPNDCSLRSAITDANNDAGADVITLPAGAYAWTGATLPITEGLTINGAGARTTAIDGAGTAPTLISVGSTPDDISVSDVTLRNTGPGQFRAVVEVDGTGATTLSRVAIVDNSTIGLQMNNGVVSLIDSLVARNTAPVVGGVVNQATGGFLLVRDSTIAQNTALGAQPDQPIAFSGGLVSNSITSLVDTTIAGNRVAPGAIPLGGDNLVSLAVNSQNATLMRVLNTIVADPGPNGNCGGDIQSSGHNLDSDGTCGFDVPSDRPNVDPQLGALADNGGPTDTRALSQSSPAIDAGAGCAATDQRGVARPAGGACDIGAFESPFTAPAPVVVPPVTPPTNTAPADTKPPVVTVSGIGKTVRRKTFNKGLKVKIGANEPITADLILLAQPRKVTIAKVPSVALATTTLSRAGGTRTVTLKPSPKVGGRRKVKMQLRVVAYDAAGNRTAKTVSFTVK
jgi:hypothetical protein